MVYMKRLINFIIRILANSIAILIAVYFVPGIIFKGDMIDLVTTGFILALANSIIKPILRFITGPLIVLTMGLFTIIINILILWLVTILIPNLVIVGFWAYFWGVVIISILNAITSTFAKHKA